MDEPTSSLPREDVTRLFALIRRLKASGVTIVYISHFLEEVREIADRFTVLRDGRSVAAGTLTDVTNEALIAHMVGRPVDALFPERAPEPQEDVLVDVVDVASPPAVRRAAFRLRRGEILGVAGLVGSGRTETIRALMGLEPAESGDVRVHGRRLARTASPATRLGAGLGYLSEDRKGEGLALAMSLADNITCTRYRACSTRGWLRRGAQRDQARTWMEALARQGAQPVAGGADAVRRQPAEGGAGPAAAPARRRAAPRRAHQGHRHRQQGGDLSRHRRVRDPRAPAW